AADEERDAAGAPRLELCDARRQGRSRELLTPLVEKHETTVGVPEGVGVVAGPSRLRSERGAVLELDDLELGHTGEQLGVAPGGGSEGSTLHRADGHQPVAHYPASEASGRSASVSPSLARNSAR